MCNVHLAAWLLVGTWFAVVVIITTLSHSSPLLIRDSEIRDSLISMKDEACIFLANSIPAVVISLLTSGRSAAMGSDSWESQKHPRDHLLWGRWKYAGPSQVMQSEK